MLSYEFIGFILQSQSEMLNRKNLQGNLVVQKLDSLIVLAFLHLESCQSSGRLAEVWPSIKLHTQCTSGHTLHIQRVHQTSSS